MEGTIAQNGSQGCAWNAQDTQPSNPELLIQWQECFPEQRFSWKIKDTRQSPSASTHLLSQHPGDRSRLVWPTQKVPGQLHSIKVHLIKKGKKEEEGRKGEKGGGGGREGGRSGKRRRRSMKRGDKGGRGGRREGDGGGRRRKRRRRRRHEQALLPRTQESK